MVAARLAVPSALVTGVSGVLGSVLVRHLLRAGWMVRGACRRPPQVEGVEPIPADILDTDAMRRGARGVDVVFHLAAAVDTLSRRDDELMRRANVEGTMSVARAAREEGVGRLVYFSTTAVYGSTHRSIADERSAPDPESPYARTKLEAEKIVLDDRAGVVLRVAAVYGPSVPGRYVALARLHRGGVLQIVGTNRRTLVFENDLADAAILAASHSAACGRIFNVTDGTSHSLTAITSAMRAALGRTRPAMRLSADILARQFARLGDPFSHTALVSAVRKVAEDSAVDGAAIQRELGFVPRWDLDAGWRATIAAWRAERRL